MATIIGLTGGIASGKSTASVFFRNAGLPVIDADALSRELTGPGGIGSEAVGQAFGDEFLTPERAMDRDRMRSHVFQDFRALTLLESVLHPLIARRVEEEFSKLTADTLAIYDCPLLYRKALRPLSLSRILVIDTPDHLRLQRLQKRPGIDQKTALGMMHAQPARQDFLNLADDIICNSGTENEFREALCRYLEKLCQNSSPLSPYD